MLRYQKLIQSAVSDPDVPNNAISRNSYKKNSYNELARRMKVSTTTLYEWATTHKVPSYKSLEAISAHFCVPTHTLLMDDDEPCAIEIAEALHQLNETQKQQVALYIREVLKNQCQ